MNPTTWIPPGAGSLRMALILPVLLLFSEAHVSQSFHTISMEKLIRMSGTILLVRKDVPYSVTDTIPTDPTGTHPDFHSLRHRYLVLKVFKPESLNAKAVAKAAVKSPIKIDDDNTKRYAYRIDLAMERKHALDEIEALIKPKRKFWSWLTPQGRK